jgi:hypothetical protein
MSEAGECLVGNFSPESRRQQILAFEAGLLPLCLVGFMGSMAEAAKSCF